MTAPVKDFSFGIVPVRRQGGEPLYLLVQHRAGHWAFPKGHAEAGETPLQAALREFREETGITRVEVRETPVFTERYATVKGGRDVDKTVTYFLGWTDQAAVTVQPEEIRDHVWLSFDRAMERMTHEASRGVLRQADRAVRVADSRQG